MTAKEIAEQCYNHMTGLYVFDDEDLQEFIDQLCKEQRGKCAQQAEVDYRIDDGEAYIDKDWILNAPQPEGK